MRIENDSIGSLEIPDKALYGIHSLRSFNNFPESGEKVNIYLIKAYFLVKLAAVRTNFKSGLLENYKSQYIEKAIEELIEDTDQFIESEESNIYNNIIVDPYQGGAGTSLNMNINEIIANKALLLSGSAIGDYSKINPLDDVNLSQSTNDTYVTALKIASIYLLRELAESYSALQRALQDKENEFAGIIKLGRTQLQDAVPITLGQEFGAFAQAIARDRWRLYNAEERLRSVNLGGTAVGNSIAASRNYILNINAELKKITGLPVAKSEDLIDATQNMDVFSEVSGIVTAGAVSLIKICNDLRFLSSGPNGGIGEIILPSKQAGSSIMPGKINPVILENTIQIAEFVKSGNSLINNLCSAGNLELNAFSPLIAHMFLKSLEMLKNVNYNLVENCIKDIKANKERCRENLLHSSALAATLINHFGYSTIEKIVKESEANKTLFIDELYKSKLLDEQELLNILSKEIGIKIE